MLKNPQTEEQMIAAGAEFRVDQMYFKYIDGVLYRTNTDYYTGWAKACDNSKHYYKGFRGFVDLKPATKEGDNDNMKDELYASLELQISMAQDYSEWLKQETKRNDELLNAHSTALRRLNTLMVQSPSEKEKVDSGRGEGLPDGLKWEDVPAWATHLAKGKDVLRDNLMWCNSYQYSYVGEEYIFPFDGVTLFTSTEDLEIIATRPKGV